MSINRVIFRNLKKNFRNYYLYVFALIFTVSLYFAFVTLQYDPEMDPAKGSIKGAAAFRAASVLLIVIVSLFLLYANHIFIKRRSKEIGMLQLIGMTKGNVFRLLFTENFILYFLSLFTGIFIGFSCSKFLTMILFKITGVHAIANLTFSKEAFLQTMAVFSAVFMLITITEYLFIKRMSILSLFSATSTTEVKNISFLQLLLGIMGIALILIGYFISSKLFSGEFTTMNELFNAMIFILASVIFGTYLFYKGTVSFLFYLYRKSKGGYLNIREVMSLSSIMFRMKSNALLLTIITTVSALAVGLLSLSYISYYSTEKTALQNVAADFALTNKKDAEQFKKELERKRIRYDETVIDVIQVNANISNIVNGKLDGLHFNPANTPLPVINERDAGLDLSPEEALLTGYHDALKKFLPLKNSGLLTLKGKNMEMSLKYLGLKKDFPISYYFTNGGLPVVIVDEKIFQRLSGDMDPKIQKEGTVHIGIHIRENEKLQEANRIFVAKKFAEPTFSKVEMIKNNKMIHGLSMFIVGFLGLTFLITSGCILYFKQMGECEDEKGIYTILRKLGFTSEDLLAGIRWKQLFNFGIPLLLGISHGYFAVQAGWFFFGTELWTPMLIVIGLYSAMYSIFGLLSAQYYRREIQKAL